MIGTDASPPADPAPSEVRRRRRRKIIRVVQLLVSLVIVVGIYAGILPKIADYSTVWKTITGLSSTDLALLVAVTAFNIFTYWPQMMAAMPGLTLAQAAVNNQSSTTIANTLPTGGAIAVGVAYQMFRSWGFTNSAIALMLTVTGVWNTFIKLAMPIVALVLLAITGHASASLLIPALIGLAILAGCIVAFGLVLWRKELARAVGSALGRAASWVLKLARRPPVTTWGEAAVRFRKQTIHLVEKRWPALTVTTVVSHVGLYFVLLIALRKVGIPYQTLSWAQILGVFAFARLVSALPLTPGGLGLVELSYIGGLVLAGRNHATVSPEVFRAQVAAAVLLFRALTYGAQIPLGGITYLIWMRMKRWRKTPPDAFLNRHGAPAAQAQATEA